jgi:hypothetical protein
MTKITHEQELSCSTNTAGIALLLKELKTTKVLNTYDNNLRKHSGFKPSQILESSIIKNVLGISTLTEACESFEFLPEYPLSINRTTLSRNFTRIGELNNHNLVLEELLKYLVNIFKITPEEILIIIDETTIEVSKNSSFENASWVFDNAQGKVVFGYYVSIIVISFRGIFIPVQYTLYKPLKSEIIIFMESIRNITGSNKISFDGGYACDEFFEELTKREFIFYSKVPKSWIFNNGLNESVEEIKEKNHLKKNKYNQKILYRVKDSKNITNIQYSLNFKKNDKRTIITNDLKINPSLAFKKFKKRWDVETCNAELKENFCFEKLPIRNQNGIIAYLLTCFIALILINIIKLKNKRKLKSLFNKGFKKLIRIIIKVKGIWDSAIELTKIRLLKAFRYKWIFKKYNLI